MYGDIKYGADRNPDPETLLSGRGGHPAPKPGRRPGCLLTLREDAEMCAGSGDGTEGHIRLSYPERKGAAL